MKFYYQARTKTGELQVGVIEGVNREAALNSLLGHELFVLSLESTEKINFWQKLAGIFERVKVKDLMVFTRQFATLLSADIPLSDSLKALYRQTANPLLKEAIFEVFSDVNAGLSLSQALGRQSSIFSDFYISMVRSAEVTGRMEQIISYLADYLERETNLLSRIRNALIYPITVIVLFIIVAALMVTMVIPQLRPVFEEAGVELPPLTRLLMSTGEFLAAWWWVILIIIFIFAFILIDYFRTFEGKAVKSELEIKLPVIGPLFQKIYITRFSQSASVLIKGGIPIAQAIEIAGHTVGNVVYRDILYKAAEGIRQGETMSAVLERSGAFPPLVYQMVAVGESTGRLEELLDRIAKFYAQEIENITGNLVELIQPALIVIVGILVAFLFASILLPIYNLAQLF